MAQNTSSPTPLKVALTGGAGQIAYSLIPKILSGQIFGRSTEIDLRLLEVEAARPRLEGVAMEIRDACFALAARVVCTSSMADAFDGADYAVLVGGFPRAEGMQRRDLLAKNRPIFSETAKGLARHASPSVRVLVVANPANTNALEVLARSGLPRENVTALTRLDANRARAALAAEWGVSCARVGGALVWGNHSGTQVVDIRNAKLDNAAKAYEGDQREFMAEIAGRGAQVIKARGMSSAMSAAEAIKDHLRDWHFGSEDVVSMAVSSDGNPFGVAEGLVFSFPVTVSGGRWRFAESVKAPEENSFLGESLRSTEKELIEEKEESGKLA